MKRPSAWPLLMILVVIGTGFVLLVFHDRIRQAEAQVAQVQQTFQSQHTRMLELEQRVDQLSEQMSPLLQRLAQLDQGQTEQTLRAQGVSDELQVLRSSIPTQLPQRNDDLSETFQWVISISALMFALFEFILQ
ncbi:MAG TPA: hypothetical protein VIL47_02390 [Candidatus Bipolaricaulota bacterium]